MSTPEAPSWAKKYLDNFEDRMDTLENPGAQKQPDEARQKEDEFVILMKEINTGPQADQAGDGGNEEENFIDQMRGINN
jgi:hypothetical protein